MKKKIGILVMSFVIIFLVFMGGYRILKWQGHVEPWELNTWSEPRHYIVASQSTSFKDEVIHQVKEEVVDQDLYLKGIDISELAMIEEEKWDGIIILSTIESDKLYEEVERFMSERNSETPVLLLNTADSGDWSSPIEGVDVITSPSKKENIQTYVKKITSFFNK